MEYFTSSPVNVRIVVCSTKLITNVLSKSRFPFPGSPEELGSEPLIPFNVFTHPTRSGHMPKMGDYVVAVYKTLLQSPRSY